MKGETRERRETRDERRGTKARARENRRLKEERTIVYGCGGVGDSVRSGRNGELMRQQRQSLYPTHHSLPHSATFVTPTSTHPSTHPSYYTACTSHTHTAPEPPASLLVFSYCLAVRHRRFYLNTAAECSSRILIQAPLRRSHTRMVLS